MNDDDENVVKAVSEAFVTEQARMRSQLLEAMSGWSEEYTCASWISELDRRLHKEGGIWELIASETGWPVDTENKGRDFTWLTWQEAGEIYKHPRSEAKRLVVELEAHGLDEEGHLKECGG